MAYRIYHQPDGINPAKYIVNSRAGAAGKALGGSAGAQIYRHERHAAQAAQRLSERFDIPLGVEEHTGEADHGLMQALLPHVSSYGTEYLEAACAGDSQAALSLSVSCDKPQRGYVAAIYCDCDAVPGTARRTMLSLVWETAWGALLNACDDLLISDHELFWRLQFPIPAYIPEHVSVYRGICLAPGETLNDRDLGLSWTLSRDTAIWFSRRGAENATHVLASAQVNRDDIMYYSDDRREQEVLLYVPPEEIGGRCGLEIQYS